PSGNEISSNKVHIYDPDSNQFLADGAAIPLAIDDHVQAVWRDSLIYVITGWSNTSNRVNVQIYNPALDTWAAGTQVPNNNIYKSFGASGLIKGDTIYYYGGASMAGAFNVQNQLRMGIIDPADPTQITWSNPLNFAGEPGYRCAATFGSNDAMYWIGGSKITYNYNGIAYNGSGGVPPADRSLFAPAGNINGWFTQGLILPMDLRGIAEIDNSFGVKRIIAGGMEAGQTVSRKTLLLEEQFTPGFDEISYQSIFVYPNPVKAILYLDLPILSTDNTIISIYNSEGRVVQNKVINNSSLNVSELNSGIYFIRINSDDKYFRAGFIK
ncbi:MAG: T9SS type A sorting domain-containing protein, partial [Bacteroidia bacterium]|nr:T9SS type A sorting domain-containing protein [Bacteroidia bacterium]